MSQLDDEREAQDEFVAWAKSVGLDDETINTIWDIGSNDPLYSYDSVQNLYESDGMGVNPGKDGFVFVGYCPNGDQIAIDVREDVGSVWYVAHDQMHTTPLREVCVRVGHTLYDTYHELCDEDDFPYDYYDAKEKLAS